MKVFLLSRYGDLGASSRVRYLQYLPQFRLHGWEVEICPLFSNSYLQNLYSGQSRIWETLKGYFSRLLALQRVHAFDVLIIEKELLPYIPAWFERILHRMQIPYIVDYDDALFHSYDMSHNLIVRVLLRHKIDTVMRKSSLVIAGNTYLAERARNAGAHRVEIIPTVVDTDRYVPVVETSEDMPIVGWMGTPQTSRYLEPLLPVFERLQQELQVRFVAVGASAKDFLQTPVESWPWSESSEVSSIQQFDIGIMPLTDSPWERGKCGYKLIQCMACAKPIVASPVGVNAEIVEPGINGYLANSIEEWAARLRVLLKNANLRNKMGNKGRKKVIECYSLRAQCPRLIKAIEKSISENK